MKVDTQNVGPCKVKLIVKAEADETRNDYDEVLKVFMREGRVHGFRPGKVPREIIKREFHSQIMEEVQRRLFQAFYKPALEQAGVKMVALRDIDNVLFSPETGITFTMTVDAEPEFDLPKYKKIPVTFDEPTVTEEQVDEQLDQLRKAFAKFEEAAPEYAIAAGDLVSIDFTGLVDDQPIHTLAEEAKPISEGTGFWVQIEEGRFVQEVLDALVGVKVGETQEVKVKFPKDHPIEALRGKKAVYTVTPKLVRTRQVAEDAELLAQFKLETLDQLRDQTRKRMLEAAVQAEEQRRRDTVVEFLLKKAEFDLPESLVADEINAVLDTVVNEAHYRVSRAKSWSRTAMQSLRAPPSPPSANCACATCLAASRRRKASRLAMTRSTPRFRRWPQDNVPRPRRSALRSKRTTAWICCVPGSATRRPCRACWMQPRNKRGPL